MHAYGQALDDEPARLAPTQPSVLLSCTTVAGVRQTFVPARFLRGLLPEALLQQYSFWLVPEERMLLGLRPAAAAAAAGLSSKAAEWALPALAALGTSVAMVQECEGVVLLSGDAVHALLACVVAGRPKELVLLRVPLTLHVHSLVEHGRRWCRGPANCIRAAASCAHVHVCTRTPTSHGATGAARAARARFRRAWSQVPQPRVHVRHRPLPGRAATCRRLAPGYRPPRRPTASPLAGALHMCIVCMPCMPASPASTLTRLPPRACTPSMYIC